MSLKNNFTYQKNFWQNYKVISQHFMNKQKELTNIYYIFNKLSDILSDFSNGLNFISSYPFDFEIDSTFGKAMKIFIDLIKKESDLTINFTKNILESIMLDISSEIDNIVAINNDIITGRSKSLNEFINSLFQTEIIKKEYHAKVAKALQKKLEITKKKGKESKDLIKLINEAVKSRDEYKKTLNECNKYRLEYINKSNDTLIIFEKREKRIIDSSKNQIIKYCKEKMKIFENLTNEIKKDLEESFEKINSQLDTNQFVEKNKSLGSQPLEVSFMEYSPDIAVDSSNIQEKNLLIKTMKEFIDNKFRNLDEKEEIIQETRNFCDGIWTGTIDEKNLNILIKHFSKEENGKKIMEKKICLYFLNYFNKKRTTGEFAIDDKTFIPLNKCLNNILDLNNNDICDYEVCSLIIILSLTFFKYDVNKGKEYLENKIEGHNIFKKKEFWFDLTSYYIQENYQDQEKGTIGFIEELDEENNKKIKSVIDAKISTILYNMKQFHVPIPLVKELSIILCNKFNIDKNLINVVWSLFKDDKNNRENEEDSYQIFVEQEEIKNDNPINFNNVLNEFKNNTNNNIENNNINNHNNNNIENSNIINTDKKND